MQTPESSEDTAPASVAEADERVERAKESLSSRIEELGRRFKSVKNMGHLGDRIAEHPWPAVGIAFALGAFAGLASHVGSRDENGDRRLRDTLLAGAGALVLRLAKSFVM